MRNIPESIVKAGHPDFSVLDQIAGFVLERTGGKTSLEERLPALIRDAVDFVLDPIRTGRTRLADLDNVEKTFIGLKVEHFIRDMLDVPKGLRDLVIDGMDVDVKNTTRDTWMIPPEIYRSEEPCIVVAFDEQDQRCWMGVLLARDAYLNSPNQDKKRSVKKSAFKNILWLVEEAPYPKGHWDGLDMRRFRDLREIDGGTKRAAQFFRENIRRPVHRSVIQALLFDQRDYMKRLRGNQGARDILRTEGIALLSGFYDKAALRALKAPHTGDDEMIAISPRDRAELDYLKQTKLID
ncbi:MAG: hypothetical protein KF714_11565 [Parvibaculum sp.]|nr:hypothetical protein [Parvibaculum sp.]